MAPDFDFFDPNFQKAVHTHFAVEYPTGEEIGQANDAIAMCPAQAISLTEESVR